jgi:hypothetical protein
MIKQYIYNLLVACSQFISVIFGGNVDESLSQRLGKAKRERDLSGRSSSFLNTIVFIVDGFFYFVFHEQNHCLDSTCGEKNTKELWRWY